MCGLFGTIRPHTYSPAIRQVAASAMLDLGMCAEERGTDSSGLATLHARCLTAADSMTPDFAEITDGRWRIATALGPFGDRLPGRPRVRRDLQTALVVLGHTRWATQGVRSLANASPMRRGGVLGTHNGDVTVWPNLPSGGTDSAWLFSQLDRARSLRSTTAVLVGLRGRAALAWTRLSQPEYVFLARAALSPLAAAVDREGALWWASNPAWLRLIGRTHRLGLCAPTMIPEGILLAMRSMATAVQVVHRRTFVPTCRLVDERLADFAVWRGFDRSDENDDRAALRHRLTDLAG